MIPGCSFLFLLFGSGKQKWVPETSFLSFNGFATLLNIQIESRLSLLDYDWENQSYVVICIRGIIDLRRNIKMAKGGAAQVPSSLHHQKLNFTELI